MGVGARIGLDCGDGSMSWAGDNEEASGVAVIESAWSVGVGVSDAGMALMSST